MNKDFKTYVEEVIIPQMKEANIVKVTLYNAEGDRAFIIRDKHGFYKVTFTWTKQYY